MCTPVHRQYPNGPLHQICALVAVDVVVAVVAAAALGAWVEEMKPVAFAASAAVAAARTLSFVGILEDGEGHDNSCLVLLSFDARVVVVFYIWTDLC